MSGREFVVGTGDADDRLDVVLARLLDESRSRAAARIDREEVTVDGEVAVKSLRLQGGETIVVAAEPETPGGAAGVAPPPVRYEDEHLLVVAKPGGMVVHPGVGNPSGTLVQTLAAAGYPLAPAGGPERPGIVHRLDRGTSGLLVVAKDDEAFAGLVRLLSRHDVERGYLALVEGELPAATGRVEAPIGRDPGNRQRFAVVAAGKGAVTHWQVRDVGRVRDAGREVSVSLVECRLETGRTHQIRVHLSYAGHPVVADRRYGARRDLPDVLGLSHPFLHAGHLRFVHPVTGSCVEVDEPPPDVLVEAALRAGLSHEVVTAPVGARP